MRLILLLAVVLVAVPGATPAQDFQRNAFGVYAAPTIYGFSNGSAYDLANSGGGLDLGFYYERAFSSAVSGRLELRWGSRSLDDLFEVGDPLPGAYSMVRLSEQILEIPLILQSNRRIPLSDHELKVSVGAGISTKFVLDQKLLGPRGELEGTFAPIAADSYRKVGVLVDGGATFATDKRRAIFLRLRLDVDIATAGEPADADVIRRFWATGMYAGFEYGF